MRKRIAALATALIGLGLIVLPATPAHAVLGLYRMAATSATDSISPKSATVSCNAGDDLLSVGGRINGVNGGGGDVLLTRAIADAALTTGTAWGIEANVTGALWSVEVIITCAPAGAVSNLTLEETTVGPSVNDKTALASCDQGQLVFGSGFYLVAPAGTVVIDEVRYGPNLDYVVVQSYDYVAPPSYSLTAQAICGDPAAIHYRVTQLSASNPNAPKSESAGPCMAGSDLSAAGGTITGALGLASLTVLNTPPTLDSSNVTAREVGALGTNWSLEAQGICVG